jgi:hypothetical protein
MLPLKVRVKQALNNAAENGYFFEDMTPEQIAVDMCTYSSELEDELVVDVACALIALSEE